MTSRRRLFSRSHPFWNVLLAAALAAGSAGRACAAGGSQADESPDYVRVKALNAGMPKTEDGPDLETPRVALENFIVSCRQNDYARAARSLNLNSIRPEFQAAFGPELARRLKAVIDQQIWFDWGDIPDRPDGQDEGPSLFQKGPDGKGPRSSVRLGAVTVDDIVVDVRLERVKPADGPPVWMFSRQTVEHIPDLYRRYRPSPLEARVPPVLKRTMLARVALWQWIGFAVTLVVGGAIGWVVQRALNLGLRWTPAEWARTAAEAIRGPGALTIGLWVSQALAYRFLGLAGPVLSVLEPLYAAVLVGGAVWFVQRLIGIISARVCRRYETHGGDDANVLLTRITVARHVTTFLVIVFGAAYALSRFEWFRQMGTTLLASAGVAGLILGIAAQRVLGNLFAGLILALTQPVKSGDAILFEGEFGWIEEIATTYVVIRAWDLRRIVVPITYLLDKPFQNWSRRSQQLMLPVYVHADYRVDVDAVRAEFKAALESSCDWDKAVPPILQVTACKEDVVELRALCSASNPASSWNLQCYVRERLTRFITTYEGGRYIPRRRVALVDDPAGAPPGHPSSNGHAAAPPPRPEPAVTANGKACPKPRDDQLVPGPVPPPDTGAGPGGAR